MTLLKQLFLYLTYECNMRCKHCWVHSDRKINPLDSRTWINAITEAQDLGLELVKITGGEPFLEKSLLFTLIDTGMEYTVETNGTLLTESDVELLSRSKIREIGVSIDFPDSQRFEAFRDLPHSFERVTNSITLLHEYSIPTVSIMSVFKDNLGDIPAVADLVFGLGADKLKAHPVMAMGKAKAFSDHLLPLPAYKELAHTLEEMERMYPGKIGTSLPWVLIADFASNHLEITRTVCEYKSLLTILPNGDISLCGVGITNPSTIVGNIQDNTLFNIWENKPGLLAELHDMDSLHLQGVCGRCIFRKYCANMCPAYVYDTYRTFSSSHPLCEELRSSGLFPEKYLV